MDRNKLEATEKIKLARFNDFISKYPYESEKYKTIANNYHRLRDSVNIGIKNLRDIDPVVAKSKAGKWSET